MFQFFKQKYKQPIVLSFLHSIVSRDITGHGIKLFAGYLPAFFFVSLTEFQFRIRVCIVSTIKFRCTVARGYFFFNFCTIIAS